MIHECYPGHHFQFYLEKRVQLRASKDHDSDSNSDGWAEYGKYMLVDKVYAPKNLFYRLAVLLSKRSYIAAAIAGMEIHMQKKTLQEASDFLMEKQGRTRENTYIWVLNRATHYPTHLTYYIGSEMVRKLHDDYKALKKGAYSLKEFNDRFLMYGLIPIKIIRKDMLERSRDDLPTMLDYRTHVKNGSRSNTPPVFAVYILGLVCRWLEKTVGGLAAMDRHNVAKAKLLYDVLDGSQGFYAGHAQPECRSDMNVTFRLPSEALEKQFVAGAVERGLLDLKGHRSVGGIRASIYNAMPVEGVESLRDYMIDFQKTRPA